MASRVLGTMILLYAHSLGVFGQSISIGEKTATIYGNVLDENDGIEAIASVTATRVAPTIQTYSTDVSPLTGSFGFQDIPPGTYELCAQPASSVVVDECQWTRNKHRTQVVAGQTVMNLRVGVRRASVLRVRVEDPANFAGAAVGAKSIGSAAVILGVIAPHGVAYPMAVESSDSTGTSYAVAIPVDLPLNLSLFTPHLAMSDKSVPGKEVALTGRAQLIPFRYSRGAFEPPSFRFAVTAGALP